MQQVSSPVGVVVGKKTDPLTTHPVADLALKVAGGWWTKLA